MGWRSHRLSLFHSTHSVNWANLMVPSLVTVLPMVIFFLLAERLSIAGIAVAGGEG